MAGGHARHGRKLRQSVEEHVTALLVQYGVALAQRMRVMTRMRERLLALSRVRRLHSYDAELVLRLVLRETLPEES